MILVDTSGLLAAWDENQPLHEKALATLRRASAPRLLSPFVLAELDYLIQQKRGVHGELTFLEEVTAGSYQLEHFDPADVAEARDVVRRYTDLGIGLADASIVVLARRHDVHDVLTLDERHFRVLRGPRDRPFRVLPADA